MPIPFEQIKDSALNLDINSRANLAQILLKSLDDLSDTENDEIWLAEAERRQRETLDGKAQLHNREEVFRHVADLLNERVFIP